MCLKPITIIDWNFKKSIYTYFGHMYCSVLEEKKRAERAQTMAYSESNILSRQLHTVKTIAEVQTVAECQDSCRKSRQLQKVKTVVESQDSCRKSRQLQTVKRGKKTRLFVHILWISILLPPPYPRW